MLDLEKLKQLVAFADIGTLSKVAEEFHISTPSITRSMQSLEEYLGVSLFNRGKNKIELNETGHITVDYARNLLQEEQKMVAHIRAFDERQKTIVVKSCAPAPMWKILKKLALDYAGTTISSSICQNEEILQVLEQDTCDIAILPFSTSTPCWKSTPFMEEHLFVCVPPDHEFAKHTSLHFSDLNGFNFLLRSELGFWDTLCRTKMPASKFLVQNDEAVFTELVNASSLPCFTTDYIQNLENLYPNRINIPITDTEANVTFYLVTKDVGKFMIH